jgi:hypothetical protein
MFKVVTLCLVNLLARRTLQCPDERNCLSCPVPKSGNERICSRCENSFFNTATKQCDAKVTNAIDHCKFYTKIGERIICSTCDYGYFLDTANNQCTSCKVDGCAICNDSNLCFGCFSKKRLNPNNNTCEKDQTCEVPNCEICVNDNTVVKCAQCEKQFALSSLTDGKCLGATPNCYLIDASDFGKCLTCNYGYFITSDGTCEANAGNMWWILLIVIPIAAAIVYFVYSKLMRTDDDIDTYTAS